MTVSIVLCVGGVKVPTVLCVCGVKVPMALWCVCGLTVPICDVYIKVPTVWCGGSHYAVCVV